MCDLRTLRPVERLVHLLSLTHSIYDRFTVSDIKLDLDDFRSRSRHLSAPTHRPGPSGSLKLRIFIITLSRSPKSWFSVKIGLKRDGGCYKSISTVKFWEPFPDWSDTKGVCPYTHWGVRNRFVRTGLWVTLNKCTTFVRDFENPGSRTKKTEKKTQILGFHDIHWVSISVSKVNNFPSFFFYIETHEGSPHEKSIRDWFRSL